MTEFNATKDGGKWKGASGNPNYKQKAGGKAGGNASTYNRKLKSIISFLAIIEEIIDFNLLLDVEALPPALPQDFCL